jgi:hypothetical protein
LPKIIQADIPNASLAARRSHLQDKQASLKGEQSSLPLRMDV